MNAPAEQPVTVFERNDPTLVFLVSLARADGQRRPYPTAERTWEFFIKNTVGDPDPAPIPASVLAAQNTAVASAVKVELTAEQVGSPGKRTYRLDAIHSGRRQTVARGTFTVVDT